MLTMAMLTMAMLTMAMLTMAIYTYYGNLCLLWQSILTMAIYTYYGAPRQAATLRPHRRRPPRHYSYPVGCAPVNREYSSLSERSHSKYSPLGRRAREPRDSWLGVITR